MVRRLIDPAAPEPRFTGQHVIYGYATGSDPDACHRAEASVARIPHTDGSAPASG